MQQQDRNHPIAVIVIDVQAGRFQPQPRYDADTLLERATCVIDCARSNSHPLFVIRHNGEQGAALAPTRRGRLSFESLAAAVDASTRSDRIACSLALQARALGWVEPVVWPGTKTKYDVFPNAAGALVRAFTVMVAHHAHSSDRTSHGKAQGIRLRQGIEFGSANTAGVVSTALGGKPNVQAFTQ